MKITIDNIEVNGDSFKATANLSGFISGIEDNDRYDQCRKINDHIHSVLGEKISEILLKEKGPEILSKISENQIINSVLLKLSNKFLDERR